MRSSSTSTESAPNFETLTADVLLRIREKLPLPTYKAVVVKPTCEELLRRYFSQHQDPEAALARIIGLPIYVKQRQLCDCWAFKDISLMRLYLADDITELDLAQIQDDHKPTLINVDTSTYPTGR